MWRWKRLSIISTAEILRAPIAFLDPVVEKYKRKNVSWTRQSAQHADGCVNCVHLLEIWLVLNRRRRGPLDLWEVPKPSVPPVAEAASASGSETVLVLVALITTKSAVNEQYTNFFSKRPTFRTPDCMLRQGQRNGVCACS